MVPKLSKKKILTRISIISHDVIGEKMAGPGIRFYEFAKILSKSMDVTLHIPNKVDMEIDRVKLIHYNIKNYNSLSKNLKKAEVILIQGHILYYFPFLKNFSGKIIVDLYNPFHLESLEMFKDSPIADRLRIDQNNNHIIKLQLAIGDFFICASEKQRSYWTGMLSALGRVNPFSYDTDNTLRTLIDVVPSGMPSNPPKRSGSPLSSIIPNILEGEKILLWGGGIWNWLDPITAIKAFWETTRERDDMKFLFMGIKHPDPKLPEMKKCLDAIKLSKELGLYNDKVFFNEWIPYDMRQTVLLESEVGLSIHQKRIETDFSYRTRVLDYIWAGLPVITTEGDSIAKIVKEENIGEVVKYKNTNQLARVMGSMLSNKSLQDIYKKNIKKIRSRFFWENVTRPLVSYCRNPQYSVDKDNTYELIKLQNERQRRLIQERFTGSTNVLMITRNKKEDRNLVVKKDMGNVYYFEIGNSKAEDKDTSRLDEIGNIKAGITQRTKFDGIIIPNVFSKIKPKFFYDLMNVVSGKLKKGGLLFLSIPENKGLLQLLTNENTENETELRVDEFTIEYIFKNLGFHILDKGEWDNKKEAEKIFGNDALGQSYGKNELLELFEIVLDKSRFEKMKLLSRFDILKSQDHVDHKPLLMKLKNIKMYERVKKYMYLLTSMYFEGFRRSYNQSMKTLNNNIQIQINDEINRLNQKNRERMLFIYFNIFKELHNEMNGLGYDIRRLKEVIDTLPKKKKSQQLSNSINQNLEVLSRNVENIDKILGLSITHKYFLVQKSRYKKGNLI